MTLVARNTSFTTCNINHDKFVFKTIGTFLLMLCVKKKTIISAYESYVDKNDNVILIDKFAR